MVRSERVQLSDQLRFRGLPRRISRTLRTCRRSVRVGRDAIQYTGPVTRVKLVDRVHPANEAPVDEPIGFHHDTAPDLLLPRRLETSIVPSHIIVQRMEELAPEFVLKLEQDGFLHRVKISGKPDPSRINLLIRSLFIWVCTAKEKTACDSVKFNAEGSADLFFGPVNPIMELGGKRVWFKSILSYTDEDRDVGASFGDGNSFPAAPIDAYKKILDDNCVEASWDIGDVLLVDNLGSSTQGDPANPLESYSFPLQQRGGEMGFLEGKIAEEKVFWGKVFPKTLLPTGTRDLAEMVRGEREWLAELLQQHGAILFRGFDVGSHEEFDRVVGAFEWDKMTYIGATSRVKLSDRVYTANEAPVDRAIGFHHEMSLPSPEGGETSILPSDIIVERMEELAPEFVGKLEDEGFVFRAKTPSKPNPNKVLSTTWKQVLKTDDEEEARRRAKETFA
ncbi:hypothetical protein ACLOJK_016811 [Asimina triloba]